MSWVSTIDRRQWRALAAAQLGWMLDAMDVMFYAFALVAVQREFGLSSAQAGAVAAVTLLASAFGGILFGIQADRIGRVKVMVLSILTYSAFTVLTATAHSLAMLLLWRCLVGFGMGGEWSAGSVLVSETWPAEHRGKAMGIMQSGWAVGYILAAVISAAVLPAWGWRALFLIGAFPAVLVVWIQRRVPEPEIWRQSRAGGPRRAGAPLTVIFKPPLRRRTLTASLLTTSVLFAYWGLFTWMPSFLARPAAQGGAGLGVVKSSAWIVPMQIGAFLGYFLFGFLADRFGRRPVFVAFLIAAAVLVPVYGQMARHELALFLLGPLIGFFGHGYFSVFGALLAELFPTAVRATAQGLSYNIGRAFSALAPILIGALSDRFGTGSALAATSFFFLLGAVLMRLMPETKGRSLE